MKRESDMRKCIHCWWVQEMKIEKGIIKKGMQTWWSMSSTVGSNEQCAQKTCIYRTDTQHTHYNQMEAISMGHLLLDVI